MPREAAPATLRILEPRDRGEAVGLALRSFEGDRFYEDTLGLRASDFPVYWDELFRLTLGAGTAQVYGLERSGQLCGMILAVFHGFPPKLPAVRFLARLLARVGPRRWVRYLGFVRAYDRAMGALGYDPRREGRCLWLMVSPDAGARLGPLLVREVRAALHREGKPVGTGLINAGDARIQHFYRRLGFTVSAPFPFRGGLAATIEIPSAPSEACRAWKVDLHSSMLDVDPARWDAVGSDPLSGHAVLAALEGAGLPGVRLRALTLQDESGRWVAAAPLVTVQVDGAKLTRGLFHQVIRLVRTVRPRFLQTSLIVCGTPLSVGNPPFRIAGGASVSRVYAELGKALRQIADGEGIAWRSFKEIPAGDLPAADEALGGRGWTIAPSEPNLSLVLRWPSFTAYVDSLRSHYRYKLRLAERKLRRAGIEVDAVPLREGYDASAHALYEAVFARAAVQLEHLTESFFTALGRAHPDATRLVRFRREGKLVGWVVLLLVDGVAYDLFHGMDYKEGAASSLYFNQLAEGIRFAIEHEARVLMLGQSSETAKSRFGGHVVPLWVAVCHRSHFVNILLSAGRRWLFPAKAPPARRVFAPARTRDQDGAGDRAAARARQPVGVQQAVR